MYYRAPEKAVCADVIPFYENGEFKLFYLRDYRDISVHGEGCPWCLLTSSDLVHFHDHGPVLLRGGEEEQDLYVFTGCCIRAGEEYMIFYTGHNPHLREKGLPEQKILRATSRDLLHWKKDRDFVFAAPDWLEMHDFRDPFVFYDEERKEYCMLIAGRLKNGDPSSARGVTLLACSPDLTHWEVEKEPFYAPHAYFTHECPDLFRIGDWWYLVFSEFTDRIVTTYRGYPPRSTASTAMPSMRPRALRTGSGASSSDGTASSRTSATTHPGSGVVPSSRMRSCSSRTDRSR